MVRFVVAAAVLFFGVRALAQENVIQIEKPAIGEDVDAIITNKRMRAETGSKSKFSLASSLSYSAGSVRTPFSNERPNLSAATGTTDVSALGGSLSLKYGLNTQSALFAGVGLRWLSPLYGQTPVGYNGNKFDVDNPYVNYQYLYRWAGIQSALTLNQTFYTNTNLTRGGYVTSWSVSQNNVYDIGTTGLTFGVNVYANLGYFDNHSPGAKAFQSDYAFGLVPALEYRLTDKISLRTDSNPLSFQHVRSARGAHTYQQQRWAQTLALGITVTRDVYLYPGIQWVVGDIRSERTATWVSANINMF